MKESLSLTAWIFVDKGKQGTQKQCLGLAEALSCTVSLFPIKFPPFIAWLPPLILKHLAFLFFKDRLPSSLPSFIISGGRQASSVAAAIKKLFPSSIAIHLLNPYGLSKIFDWVIVPQHDARTRPNMLSMIGALHDLTEARLTQARRELMPLCAELPKPYTVVLIGGRNKTHTFTKKELQQLLKVLKSIKEGSLLVSVSRRTPAAFLPLIQEALKDQSHLLWYDGCGSPNPYEGFLALGERFILTSDSVSMIMETAFTGKPLHLFYLPTRSKKFKRFYHQLEQAGLLSSEGGYAAIDEKKRLAGYIQEKCKEL